MKKKTINFLLLILGLVAFEANSQRIGYYDGQYVLEQMPEYENAKKELANQIENWNKEIKELRKLLSKLKREYKIDKPLLTDSMRKIREIEIFDKEKELREKQSNTYGYKGLKYLKEKALFQPMYDEIALSVRKYSRRRKINLMIDKSADLIIIYGNKKYDYTQKILEQIKAVKGTKK